MMEHWDLAQLVPQPIYFVSFCFLTVIVTVEPLPTIAFLKNFNKFHFLTYS